MRTDTCSVRVTDLREVKRQLLHVRAVARSGRLARVDAARLEGAAKAIDDLLLAYLQLDLLDAIASPRR